MERTTTKIGEVLRLSLVASLLALVCLAQLWANAEVKPPQTVDSVWSQRIVQKFYAMPLSFEPARTVPGEHGQFVSHGIG